MLRQVGEKQARDLLLTGRIIGAEEAFRLGLVNEIVAPEKVLDRARELAGSLLQQQPASLLATKRLLKQYVRPSLDREIAAAVEENARIRSDGRFPGRCKLVSGEAQPPLDRKIEDPAGKPMRLNPGMRGKLVVRSEGRCDRMAVHSLAPAEQNMPASIDTKPRFKHFHR